MPSSLQSLKAQELLLEQHTLQPNQEILEIYTYAKSLQKNIIIISDMYLSQDFLVQVLHDKGITGFQNLYVSSHYGLTKHSGNLYKKVLQDLDITPNAMLHIGDNEYSDDIRASELGIQTFFYKSIHTCFALTREGRFLTSCLDGLMRDSLHYNHHHAQAILEYSIMFGISALHWYQAPQYSYYENLGYFYGGFICYGFAQYIKQYAIQHGITDILFVARDGYCLKSIFDMFTTNIATHYIYAPRILNEICYPNWYNLSIKQAYDLFNYFVMQYDSLRFKSPENFNPKAAHITRKNILDFIESHKNLFDEISQKELQRYKNYIHSIPMQGDRIAMVDSCTSGLFSSQNLLQKALQRDIIGLYWQVWNPLSYAYSYVCFDTAEHTMQKMDFINWDIIELFMTAPELPIINVSSDSKPIYTHNPSSHELERLRITRQITQGIFALHADIMRIFGNYMPTFSAHTLTSYINNYCQNPTTHDKMAMQTIQHASNSQHGNYTPLFRSYISWKDSITHPFKTYETIVSFKKEWTMLSDYIYSLPAIILRPLSIKIHGCKRIAISIFPLLRRKILSLEINITQRIYYHIKIGGNNG